MGFSFKKWLPSKINHHIDKAGGGSKLLAQAAPVYAVFTKQGRAEVMKNYGGIAKGVVGLYGGQQAQGFFSQVVDRFSPSNAQPVEQPSGGGGNGDGGGYFDRPDAQATGMTRWLWPVVAGVAGLVVLIFMINRRR